MRWWICVGPPPSAAGAVLAAEGGAALAAEGGAVLAPEGGAVLAAEGDAVLAAEGDGPTCGGPMGARRISMTCDCPGSISTRSHPHAFVPVSSRFTASRAPS